MTDMRARFHRADNLRPPELWSEVLERAAAARDRRAPAWPSTSPGFRLVLLLVALFVLAAAIAAVGALLRTPRPVSPEGGWIAYSVGDTLQPGRGDLYLTSLDGTPRLIVGEEADGLEQACPSFSADGSLLAYGERVEDSDGGSNPLASATDASVVIVALDSSGRPSERLRVSAGKTEKLPCPIWSPDGRAIAFIGVAHELQVVRLDGTATSLKLGARSYSWTYDSSALIVIDATQRVVLVPADGGEPVVVAETGGADDGRSEQFQAVSASPVESLLVIGGTWIQADPVASPPDEGFIRVLSYRDARVILEETGLDWGPQPAWSPDGQRLAWSVTDAVFVRAIDKPTATVQRAPWAMEGATHDVGLASGVSWSPDGTRLLFVGYAVGGGGPLYAFVSIAAEGPADPLVLSPWTDDLYWANQSGVTWQAVRP